MIIFHSKRLILISIIILSTLYFSPTFAQTGEEKHFPEEHVFKWDAYLDGSYNTLMNSNKFESGSFDRVYDLMPNGFTLQQMAGSLSYLPAQGPGGYINVIGGRDANIMAAYGTRPYSEFHSRTFAFDLTQVYGYYAMGDFLLYLGKMVEVAGAEYVDPPSDINFSRSILFGFAQPTTLTGLCGIYNLSKDFKIKAGVTDGWDTIRDWSRPKTFDLVFDYTVNSMFNFALTGYSGQERATPLTSTGPEGQRTLIDLVSTVKPFEKFQFTLDYDYAWQTTATLPDSQLGKAIWTGVAGYFTYFLTDKCQITFRPELFSDRNGYRTGVAQSWNEETLTFGLNPIKHLTLRAETRHDHSNVSSFVRKNGITTSPNQQSFALEALYDFN